MMCRRDGEELNRDGEALALSMRNIPGLIVPYLRN